MCSWQDSQDILKHCKMTVHQIFFFDFHPFVLQMVMYLLCDMIRITNISSFVIAIEKSASRLMVIKWISFTLFFLYSELFIFTFQNAVLSFFCIKPSTYLSVIDQIMYNQLTVRILCSQFIFHSIYFTSMFILYEIWNETLQLLIGSLIYS